MLKLGTEIGILHELRHETGSRVNLPDAPLMRSPLGSCRHTLD